MMLVSTAWGADTKPAEELARLKKDLEKTWETLRTERKPGTPEAERKAAVSRYYERAAAIGRRALTLAETSPDAPEAVQVLVWILDGLDFSSETAPAHNAAYDLLARRYLDRDEVLPVVRLAWADAAKTTHAESFLRAAVERSTNLKVRALACFTLGRHQEQLTIAARDLDHPARGKPMRDWLGPERTKRIRALNPPELKREAEALFERTIREFADLQPMGKDYPPLDEQARGDLFKIRNLEPDSTVPEIEGEDIDGKPLKLSDFRGKVILISFWATWCGPCMGMVPDEKALVERMKGRPFVLIGVNGDEDRSRAKEVSAKEGINWRSFWDGGRTDGIPVKWGVSAWPTVYLVDAKGLIRDASPVLRGPALDKAVEGLVAEAEAAAKKP